MANSSIWGAATHAALLSTVRLPADTSSTSGPSYITLGDILGGTTTNALVMQPDTSIANPVNGFLFTPSTAGNSVILQPQGADTNVSMILKAKAASGTFAQILNPTGMSFNNGGVSIFTLTGSLLQCTRPTTIGNPGSITGMLNLAEAGGNSFTMQAGTGTAAYTVLMPASAGTANQVLSIASVTGTVLTTAWATATGGGVTGTVNSGTQYQPAYYSATGAAVSGAQSLIFDATAGTANNAVRIVGSANGSNAAFVDAFPTGTDTTATLNLRSFNTGGAGTGFNLILAPTSATISTNGSSTARMLMTTTSATFGSALAVTVSNTLTVTGVMTNSSGTNKPTRAVTAATTTTTADYAVFANGTFTVTLHTPAAGQLLNIKNTGSGTITLSGTTDLGSATIAAGVNISLIFDTAAATWRGQ